MKYSSLYAEMSVFCIIILIVLSVRIKRSVFLQNRRRLFLRVTLSHIILLLIDTVWIFINQCDIEFALIMNWVLMGMYMIISGFLGFFWFVYSENVQQSTWVQSRKKHIIATIPLILLIILTLSSYKTGLIYYVDDYNVYHRGKAIFLQVICSYGYAIFTASKAFYLSFHSDNYQRKRELRILAFFMIPTFIGGGLQLFFPEYPIMCTGNTISILYVYISLQEQLISVDALTKLNNRNQLLQFLSVKLNHLHEFKDLYLLIIDVDYFKSINDKYGHIEGDNALKKVADCLKKVCNSKNFFLARYGGDEFVIICELNQTDSIETLCDNLKYEVHNAQAPYNLSISTGYAKYSNRMKNQQEFLAVADRELYKMKKKR